MEKYPHRFTKAITIAAILLFCSTSFSSFGQQQLVDETWESLRSRPFPQWFVDAKLGIFIHWGVYSVPSYGGPESYAEWFLRGIQVGGTNRRIEFMRRHFGEDFTYEDFAPLWKAELWDPNEWAEIFEKAGASFIILVAKHHDGFCLWPSRYAPGWNSMDVGPRRDIVGELAEAVRERNIKFGLYYSLPEWNHPLHRWYIDPHDSIHPYIRQHMIPQFKELVGTYKPHVLFTDGEWFHTAEDWNARQLISWYYNLVGPDAIVNDRWGYGSNIGFVTPEYSSGKVETDRPWREVRGIGRSFGLNRNEVLSAYKTSEDLIELFVRTVSHGGGLIINVGPYADGKIPLIQQERIKELGQWLRLNREAIHGSKPWVRSGESKNVSLRRIDPQIRFNWVRNTPGRPISEDHFTATWTGYIMPDNSGEYKFSIEADDRFRLFIDGRMILDGWTQQEEGTQSEAMRELLASGVHGAITLEKGTKYPIRVEFKEEIQNAAISLFWQSATLPREVVPQRNLFTSKDIAKGNGLNAEYQSMQRVIAYTANNGNLYAVSFDWPEENLILPVPRPPRGTRITMLGYDGYLPWRYQRGNLIINTSGIRFSEMPNHYAWTFRIENFVTK